MKKLLLISFIILGVISCSKSDDDVIIDPNPPTVGIDTAIAVDSIQTFNEIISAQAAANTLGLRFKFSDFEPTGIYVKPNATLKLNVSLLAGNTTPVLLVGTYSRGNHWNKKPIEIALQEGNNTLDIGGEGGLVYIRYVVDNNPNAKAEIKFMEGWKHSPVFKVNETSALNWKKMLSTLNQVPSVTIIGKKSMLVVSREKAINYQEENLNSLLNAIDNVIKVQNNISGMDASNSVHKEMSHKLLLSEYTGDAYYMFAYNYRTAYSNEGVQYILDEEKFTNKGWGPWHEIGHMHQMNAWTWSEIVETTVNIYSLASEKAMGITPSRMRREHKWDAIETYLAKEESDKDFNASSTSVWTRLGMFYQLQLAYGDDFYKTLHRSIRKNNPIINSDEDRMRVFMLNACISADKDLTNFFKTWGLKFSTVDSVYKEIAALGFVASNNNISQLHD